MEFEVSSTETSRGKKNSENFNNSGPTTNSVLSNYMNSQRNTFLKYSNYN